MNDDFEYIYHATNSRIAEMIRTHNSWLKGDPPYNKAGTEPPFSPKELSVLFEEASRRLCSICISEQNQNQYDHADF